MRAKLSPTFTPGKLRGMFSIMKNCGQTLEDYLSKNVENGVNVFEFRDLFARFTINIISSVAFGIDNDCINEPEHIFRKISAKIFEPNLKNGIRGLFSLLAPDFFHKIKFRSVEREVEDFFFSMVKQTVEYREEKNNSRNDFMQLLIQLKNQGFVSVDKDSEAQNAESGAENIKKLNLNQLTANVFLFFLAGFETSSSTLSFCFFEIARNPEIQKKVQEEIDRVFEAAGAERITYEMLGDLKYLECCIDEALRKYPIVPFLFRKATHDYKLADSDLIVPKGTSIIIPVLGFQLDPQIYENPMQFKPERFLNSSNGNENSEGLFYTPFGKIYLLSAAIDELTN